MVTRQIADLRRAADLAKGMDREWQVYQALWTAEVYAGNLVNAMKLKDYMLSLRTNLGKQIIDYSNVAVFLAEIGDISAARAALRDTDDAVINMKQNARGVVDVGGQHDRSAANRPRQCARR